MTERPYKTTSAPIVRRAAQPHSRNTRPPLAVLFVDPDTASAQQFVNALGNVGPVAIVPTARAALDAIQLRMPDLIVTELALPDASGIEFIAHLHTMPATQHVLLLVVTARTAIGDKIAAFQAGADDYLVKPVAPDLFVTHVQLVSRFRQALRS